MRTEKTMMEVSDEVSFGSDLVGVDRLLCAGCVCVHGEIFRWCSGTQW